MRTIHKTELLFIILAGLFLWVSACGDDDEPVQRFRGVGGVKKTVGATNKAGKGGSKKGSGKGEEAGRMVLPTLLETDFIAGNKHRDPFQPYIEVLAGQRHSSQQPQHDVKLKEYDISDLRLIAIVTNIGDPRAMVQTPDGTGFVIRRGDFVGRADFVDQGGVSGERIQLNWKVARIHGSGKEEERGVYLIRDDPTTDRGVDITRFLPLHPRQ